MIAADRAIISEKDRQLPLLKELKSPFTYP
jgi:hypothetical protein